MKPVTTFALLILASLTLASSASWAAGKPAPSTTSTEPAPHPQSVFVIDPTTGKDPFYPKSTRFRDFLPKTNEPIAVVTISFPDDIHCKGITGARLAIINDKSFAKGEKNDLNLKSGRVSVRCIDVKEKSVVLEVNGITREIGLRPTLN